MAGMTNTILRSTILTTTMIDTLENMVTNHENDWQVH